MKRNFKWNRLLSLLQMARPSTNVAFMTAWFAEHLQVPVQPMVDTYGNFHLDIGMNPTTLFMAHTDTVDSRGTAGTIKTLVTNQDKEFLRLQDKEDYSFVLGADDGAGVEILCCLAEAGTPGRYIWTANEEVGCLGTKWMLEHTPEVYEGIERAISFDRKGTTEVLTHQGGTRGCSEDFAVALGDQLGLKPSTHGVFTDSRKLFHLVPECTNIAIGYSSAHSPKEELDLVYLSRLIGDLLSVDFEALPTCRIPQEILPPRQHYPTFALSTFEWSSLINPTVDTDEADIRTAIRTRPEDVYDFLEAWDMLEEFVTYVTTGEVDDGTPY